MRSCSPALHTRRAAPPERLARVAALLVFTACGGEAAREHVTDSARAELIESDADAIADPGETREEVDAVVAPEVSAEPRCRVGLAPGSAGTQRGELASDFALPLADGRTLVLSEVFDRCASFVFIADGIAVSQLDPSSILDRDEDLMALLDGSPDDVHYVFVSTAPAEETTTRIGALRERVDRVLLAIGGGPAEHWRARLHVVATRAQELDGWVGDAILGPLAGGFVIGHDQRLAGLGSLADVTRYDPALAAAEAWPWRNNLAYAAHEAWYARAEDARRRALAAEDALLIEVFSGEMLSGFSETELTLPASEILARYDTLEVEMTLRCPDPDLPELGNCGAWDYLASLTLVDGEEHGNDSPAELARFITPYHREAHWVADITPALALLAEGGTRRLRWDFAPEWNPQPTATWMTLRLSNRARGVRPTMTRRLFTGGAFGSTYNERAPVTLTIPDGATRVEVWSLVTGHGAAEQNRCAEFCAHTHVIGVNGREHFRFFAEVGDDDACLAMIARGMTPNQAGTWWFGRGGWCPGAPVEPWVIDVTADVVPGELATFTYQGLLGGRAPPDGSGEIVMSSYLVISE